MSKNREVDNRIYCLYCKETINESEPYVTIRDFGEDFYYHTECYHLLFPPKDSELNFGR